MTTESLLAFTRYDLQTIALSWMAVLYALKVYQLTRLQMPREKAPAKGSPAGGVLRAYAVIFMPWSMESSRNHLWRWLEFSVYHVGALAAIVATFTLPYAPGLMTRSVSLVFSMLMAAAFLLGITKLAKRISRPELRLISTPDDYFSLVSLELFFGTGAVALFMNTPVWLIIYFITTAAFLFYVPFSKISHYVYFFFAGVITGGRYGYRGVRPQPRGVR